jgi:hypothetical protein
LLTLSIALARTPVELYLEANSLDNYVCWFIYVIEIDCTKVDWTRVD